MRVYYDDEVDALYLGLGEERADGVVEMGLDPIYVEKGEEMKSFRLTMPACPQCGSKDTRIDPADRSNLVRIPAATTTALMIAMPLVPMSFVCGKCQTRFKDKGES